MSLSQPDSSAHVTRLIVLCATALSLVSISGCAFTTGHVNIAYQQTGHANKVAQPDSPRVNVEVLDKRPNQAVGEKINGFGMKTADIVSDNDVAATLKSAFESELNARGFAEGTEGNLVSVRLTNFENQFTLGFFSGDATASMGMDVTVKRPDGSIAYEKYVTGQSKDWVEVAGEDNAQRELNAAMQDAVSKLFTDNDFINALKNPPPVKATESS